MKALFQDLRSGKTFLQEVPAPEVKPGHVLLRNLVSVISTGTEKMLGSFGRASLLGKVRQQPERVTEVIRKAQKDGWKATYTAIQSKLSQPIPIGYAAAGIVVAVGENVSDISVGDMLASNAPHAEGAMVPLHLCAKVPAGVSAETAAFTIPGAIALQGIRLVAPQLGETVIVIGLGLIGQLTIQLLRASGCNVIGADISPEAIMLAAPFCHAIVQIGSDDLVAIAATQTAGAGADAVILTTATDSDDPIRLAAACCRKRGRIVLVGTTGLSLSRADFFKKEITFQVSCSYGPGRYDPAYEQAGQDYPIGFVRWTEHRNMQAVLQALASGAVRVDHLIGNEIPLEGYDAALRDSSRAPRATLIRYPQNITLGRTVVFPETASPASGSSVALFGAGAFASGVLLPAITKAGLSVSAIASRDGNSAALLARRFSVPAVTTDTDEILSGSAQTICIAVPPNAAADLVVKALEKNRNVFVEKPLAITTADIDRIAEAAQNSSGWLHVGSNRRFAPLLLQAKKHFPANTPLFIRISVNAGPLPQGHWSATEEQGGGRIISEACHFIDLAAAIAGEAPSTVSAQALGQPDTDNFAMSLRFSSGGGASINYFSSGAGRLPKEHIEIHGGGKTVILTNWQTLDLYEESRKSSSRKSQDKGHAAQWEALAGLIRNGGAPLVPLQTLLLVSRAAILAKESMRSGGGWIAL